jgi:hypothetical protein
MTIYEDSSSQRHDLYSQHSGIVIGFFWKYWDKTKECTVDKGCFIPFIP